MRNLKKVLSLALAMVMLLGMMVVGAGAAVTTSDAFSDKEDIAEDRIEAVDVMTALGVFQGTDDAFNPEEVLTREQAATIVARMLLGNAADSLKATSTSYSDVAIDRWSAGYIEYCTNMGILGGYDGKFDPAGELTYVAFAKMMLCALRYKAEAEGFNGPNWAVNVATVARKAGIDTELAVNNAAMPRVDAAQMAFNTLKADVVEYTWQGESGYGYTKNITNKITDDYRLGSNLNVGAYKPDAVLQFCEMYFKNLKYSVHEADVFGDTVSQWRLVNGSSTDTITTVPVDPALTYTEYVNAKQIYEDLNLVRAASNVTKYEDGVPGAVTISNTSYQKVGGQGSVTKVWTDEYGQPTKITVINTYVGDISGVNTTTGTVTISPRDNEPVRTFKTEGLAMKDVVLYTIAGTNSSNKTVQSAEKVEPITGTLTAFADRVNDNTVSYVNGSATLGTDTYQYSEKIGANTAKNASRNKTVTAILDKYNNVIWISGPAASVASYGFVINHADDIYGRHTVRIVDNSGTIQTWEVTNDPVKSGGGYSNPLDGKLVSYKSNGNGTYTLSNEVEAVANASITMGTPITVKGSRTVNAVGVANEPALSTTVFIVRRGTNSFAAYNGISNVPSMTSNLAYNVSGPVGVKTAAIVDTTSNVVRAVYVDASVANSVKYSGTAADVIYLHSLNGIQGDATNGYYGVYTAVVNGALVYDFKATPTDATLHQLYTYSTYNATTGVTAIDTNSVATPATGLVNEVNGAVDLGTAGGGFSYDSNTRVFWVDNNKLNIQPHNIDNLPARSTTDRIWYADRGGLLSVLVIEQGTAPSGTLSVTATPTSIAKDTASTLTASFVPAAGSSAYVVSYEWSVDANGSLAQTTTVAPSNTLTGTGVGSAKVTVIAHLSNNTTVSSSTTVTVTAAAGEYDGKAYVDLNGLGSSATATIYWEKASGKVAPTDEESIALIANALKDAGYNVTGVTPGSGNYAFAASKTIAGAPVNSTFTWTISGGKVESFTGTMGGRNAWVPTASSAYLSSAVIENVDGSTDAEGTVAKVGTMAGQTADSYVVMASTSVTANGFVVEDGYVDYTWSATAAPLTTHFDIAYVVNSDAPVTTAPQYLKVDDVVKVTLTAKVAVTLDGGSSNAALAVGSSAPSVTDTDCSDASKTVTFGTPVSGTYTFADSDDALAQGDVITITFAAVDGTNKTIALAWTNAA